MSGDPKIERQYRILLMLRSTGWLSGNAIAKELEVSIRTIYRDIEDLLSLGIPIEGVRGPEGGYRLRPGSTIDPTFLSSPDSFALSMQRGRHTAEVEAHALDIPEELRSRIFFDTTDWYWRDRHSEWLHTIKEALISRNVIQIDYRERDAAEHLKRLVMPYGLVWKGGEWYLVGPEVDGPVKRFSLARVASLSATSLTFPLPPEFNIGATWGQLTTEFGRGDQRVVIVGTECAKHDLLRLQLKPDSKIEEHTDGSIKITLFVDSWRWLIPLIASFGATARVLEPEDLRRAVICFFQEALEAYSNSAE